MILNSDVACCKAELSCCCFDALEIAVTECLNSGNCHAAHEAESTVAILNCRITYKITGLLLSIHDGSGVFSGFSVGIVSGAGCAVKNDELNLGILGLCIVYGRFKEEAGAYNNLCAGLDCEVDSCEVCFVGCIFGLIVLMGDIVSFCIFDDALPSALIEALVIDVALIGDEGNLIFLCTASGEERNDHECCKQYCQQFFHCIYPPIEFWSLDLMHQ